jgi:hypothetical protein
MGPEKLKPGRRNPPTPLWVIAFFVSTAETVLGIAVTHTNGGVQVALAAFVIAFPALVAGAFFAILWFRPHHFYAPSEYGSRVGPREFAEAFAVAKPYDIDNAGDALRLFWKPDGRTTDKVNAAKIKAWMRANGLGRVAVTGFVRSSRFAFLRARAVSELKLQMRQGI